MFSTYRVEGRQIRVLKIKPLALEGPLEGTEKILCTVETINLPERSTDVSEPGYKALSWYCSQEAPWNAHIIILPDYQRIPVPNELEEAFRDIRDPFDEIAVWVYQVCINRSSSREVEEQTPLLPDIFRNASEVIIWPGMEDYSSATALAFVPEVIDLRNIDDLVIGSPSPVPTPSTNPTMRFGTPPVFRLRQDTSAPPESSRRTASDRQHDILHPPGCHGGGH